MHCFQKTVCFYNSFELNSWNCAAIFSQVTIRISKRSVKKVEVCKTN